MIGALTAALTGTAHRVLPIGQPAPVRASIAAPQAKSGLDRSPAVEVSISPEGKKISKMLASLPPLRIDPASHIKEAEVQLKTLMSELGIPSSTKVKIHSNGDGTFKVEADHPKAGELQAMINSGEARALRNALIGAHNGAVVQRIAKAMVMAMRGTEQNPSKSEQYSAWVEGIASRASAMNFEFRYNGETLSGSLLKAGNVSIGITEGLHLPS